MQALQREQQPSHSVRTAAQRLQRDQRIGSEVTSGSGSGSSSEEEEVKEDLVQPLHSVGVSGQRGQITEGRHTVEYSLHLVNSGNTAAVPNAGVDQGGKTGVRVELSDGGQKEHSGHSDYSGHIEFGGHTTSGGHTSSGHTSSGHTSSGHTSSGHTSSGHTSSGHMESSGHSPGGQASGGHTQGGQTQGGQLSQRVQLAAEAVQVAQEVNKLSSNPAIGQPQQTPVVMQQAQVFKIRVKYLLSNLGT